MLTEKLTAISDDILIYSGYELQELHELKSEHIESVISRSAVLIDGKYIAELNNNCTMKGSENQQIHIFNNKYRKAYEEYLSQENRIQNFTIGNSVISVGIHKRDFKF